MPSPAASSRLRRLSRAAVYGAVAAAGTAFLALLIRAHFHPIIDADNSAIRHATDITRQHQGFRSFLLDWQWWTQPTRVYILGTAVCLWAWLAKKARTRAWWAFGTMMIGWFLALMIKEVVQRARPLVPDPVSTAPGFSFPSGHAANAAIFGTTMMILLAGLLGRTAHRIVCTAATLVIVVTGLDRIFLGVHYPSDVVGGWFFGVVMVVASYAGYLGWSPSDRKVER